MSNHIHTLAMLLSVLFSVAACGSDSFTPEGDAGTDPTTDPALDHAIDAEPDGDILDIPVEVVDEPVEESVDDPVVDTGTDPFADPPAEGYPPVCGDDPSVCCSTPPAECDGRWQCRDGLCMWDCGDTGAFHVSCTVATDCDCYNAPVRCAGSWDCLGGTCWYFCD
jgi:hypothetical protein